MRFFPIFALALAVGGCAGKSVWGGGGDPYKTGDSYANQAIVAMFKGDMDAALELSDWALQADPKEPYALMVAGMANDSLGRTQKSRRYYEDLAEQDAPQPSVAGSILYGPPASLAEVARKRLQILDLKGSPFIITTADDGKSPQFVPLSAQTGQDLARAASTVPVAAGGDGEFITLTEAESNSVKRLVALIRLKDQGFITPAEYAVRRAANIGALLPMTREPPAAGFGRPVPEPEDIMLRMNALKEALGKRAITSDEYAAERSVIVDALANARPAERSSRAAPPAGLLAGAETVHKLTLYHQMGLLTDQELAAETRAVEQSVVRGITPPGAVEKPLAAKVKVPKPQAPMTRSGGAVGQ
ncbi:hypothetical protein FACS1894186_2580 [Alphaproteobacteria bacterium]|nr:hypothetical protein FACS1894186_2580 [Alphaproteobacteria bacterium]